MLSTEESIMSKMAYQDIEVSCSVYCSLVVDLTKCAIVHCVQLSQYNLVVSVVSAQHLTDRHSHQIHTDTHTHEEQKHTTPFYSLFPCCTHL